MKNQLRNDALITPQDLNAIDKHIYEPNESELKAPKSFVTINLS